MYCSEPDKWPSNDDDNSKTRQDNTQTGHEETGVVSSFSRCVVSPSVSFPPPGTGVVTILFLLPLFPPLFFFLFFLFSLFLAFSSILLPWIVTKRIVVTNVSDSLGLQCTLVPLSWGWPLLFPFPFSRKLSKKVRKGKGSPCKGKEHHRFYTLFPFPSSSFFPSLVRSNPKGKKAPSNVRHFT